MQQLPYDHYLQRCTRFVTACYMDYRSLPRYFVYLNFGILILPRYTEITAVYTEYLPSPLARCRYTYRVPSVHNSIKCITGMMTLLRS